MDDGARMCWWVSGTWSMTSGEGGFSRFLNGIQRENRYYHKIIAYYWSQDTYISLCWRLGGFATVYRWILDMVLIFTSVPVA